MSEDTKSKIVKSMLLLVSERGISGTSMDDLALTVGIKKASLYHYFRHKDSIVREMFKVYAPGKEVTVDIDLSLPIDSILSSFLDSYVAICCRGDVGRFFKAIESERFFSKEAGKLYIAQRKRMKKAITTLLKLIEKKKKGMFSTLESASQVFFLFAYDSIASHLLKENEEEGEKEAFISSFVNAYFLEGKNRKKTKEKKQSL